MSPATQGTANLKRGHNIHIEYTPGISCIPGRIALDQWRRGMLAIVIAPSYSLPTHLSPGPLSLRPSSRPQRSSTKTSGQALVPTSSTDDDTASVRHKALCDGGTYGDRVWWATALANLLYTFVRLGRAGLVIVKLIRLDADPEHIARVNVHPVCQSRIQQLVGGRALRAGQPEVCALLRIAIRTWFRVSICRQCLSSGGESMTATYKAVGSGRYTRGT